MNCLFLPYLVELILSTQCPQWGRRDMFLEQGRWLFWRPRDSFHPGSGQHLNASAGMSTTFGGCGHMATFKIFLGVSVLYNLVLVSAVRKVDQLCIYIYPLSFRFPPHLGPHKALSRVPCATPQVLISYLVFQ